MAYLKGLLVTQTATGYAVSGRTFDYKDIIKAIPGARWNAAEKAWTLPSDANIQPLCEVAPVRRAQQVYEPNMWAYDKVRDRQRRECCRACTREFDATNPQGPMWFVCAVHGRWKSDYTGD